ncbi:unnamed protein product [Darwinula stevensoni]|uniref:Uncharacterized protein n=1 Tax=Darwinula stevensoni TaxID=69355 RepID=A0A7R8X7W0_9CRUS|nr:unnamed protein product [Darwinula stevensoni]CAG0882743.1 unnamed protein product [Darwinula stevensoni]
MIMSGEKCSSEARSPLHIQASSSTFGKAAHVGASLRADRNREEEHVRRRKIGEENTWRGRAKSLEFDMDEVIVTGQFVGNTISSETNGYAENGKSGEEEESTESRRRNLFGDILRNNVRRDFLLFGSKFPDSTQTNRFVEESECKNLEVVEDNSNKLHQHPKRQVPVESARTGYIKETHSHGQKSDEGKHSPPAKHNGITRQKDPSRLGHSRETPVSLRRKSEEPKDGLPELMKVFHRRSLKNGDDTAHFHQKIYQMSRSQTEPMNLALDGTAAPIHKARANSSSLSAAITIPVKGAMPAS